MSTTPLPSATHRADTADDRSVERGTAGSCGEPPEVSPSRRLALAGLGGGALLLAACSDGGSDSDDANGTAGDDPAPATGADAATEGAGAGDDSVAAGLATAADVPVGGGLVLEAEGIVLTQPEAGTILGFSATCTHSGCSVNAVSDGEIRCPCHGSSFAVADGAVLGGPAPSPLPSVDVTVSDDGTVTRA